MNAILARLKEPSTAVAISVLVGLFGKQVAPETVHTLIEAATVAAALAGVAIPEKST